MRFLMESAQKMVVCETIKAGTDLVMVSHTKTTQLDTIGAIVEAIESEEINHSKFIKIA